MHLPTSSEAVVSALPGKRSMNPEETLLIKLWVLLLQLLHKLHGVYPVEVDREEQRGHEGTGKPEPYPSDRDVLNPICEERNHLVPEEVKISQEFLDNLGGPVEKVNLQVLTAIPVSVVRNSYRLDAVTH